MVSLGISLAFLLFYMLYLLIGGYLFHISECPTELRLKSKEVDRLEDFDSLFLQLEKLKDLQQRAAESPADLALQRKVVAGKREFLILISHLEHLQEDLQDKVSQPKLTFIMNAGLRLMINSTITEEGEVECEKWSLYNSMFFGFTSITTIGYGALVPQTQLGRGLCIIYTIFGIPINSLLVGWIGTTFLKKGSKLFSRFYDKKDQNQIYCPVFTKYSSARTCDTAYSRLRNSEEGSGTRAWGSSST